MRSPGCCIPHEQHVGSRLVQPPHEWSMWRNAPWRLFTWLPFEQTHRPLPPARPRQQLHPTAGQAVHSAVIVQTAAAAFENILLSSHQQVIPCCSGCVCIYVDDHVGSVSLSFTLSHRMCIRADASAMRCTISYGASGAPRPGNTCGSTCGKRATASWLLA